MLAEDAEGRPAEKAPGGDAEDLPALETILISAIQATSQEDGWAHLGSVGSYLSTRHASFDSRNYGFPTLITLARAQAYLDVEQSDGNASRVRLRSNRPPNTPRGATGGTR